MVDHKMVVNLQSDEVAMLSSSPTQSEAKESFNHPMR